MDKDGFEAFFLQSKDPLFRSMLVLVADRSLAEDAVAEAYTRAYERWTVVRQHPWPVAWVARTALNWIRSTHRKQRRLEPLEGLDIETPTADEPPVDPSLVQAVLKLPQRQREVVALRVLLDLDTEQTAGILGIAPGTVTAHLHRALSRLERDLVSQFPEEA